MNFVINSCVCTCVQISVEPFNFQQLNLFFRIWKIQLNPFNYALVAHIPLKLTCCVAKKTHAMPISIGSFNAKVANTLKNTTVWIDWSPFVLKVINSPLGWHKHTNTHIHKMFTENFWKLQITAHATFEPRAQRARTQHASPSTEFSVWRGILYRTCVVAHQISKHWVISIPFSMQIFVTERKCSAFAFLSKPRF